MLPPFCFPATLKATKRGKNGAGQRGSGVEGGLCLHGGIYFTSPWQQWPPGPKRRHHFRLEWPLCRSALCQKKCTAAEWQQGPVTFSRAFSRVTERTGDSGTAALSPPWSGPRSNRVTLPSKTGCTTDLRKVFEKKRSKEKVPTLSGYWQLSGLSAQREPKFRNSFDTKTDQMVPSLHLSFIKASKPKTSSVSLLIIPKPLIKNSEHGFQSEDTIFCIVNKEFYTNIDATKTIKMSVL